MWCVLSLDKSVSFARAVEELAGGKKKNKTLAVSSWEGKQTLSSLSETPPPSSSGPSFLFQKATV